MSAKRKRFGSNDPEQERRLAEQGFCAHVQLTLQDILHEKGISQKELAARLGVSEARVSQLFAPNFNMTLRKLAAVFHALGERPFIALAERARKKKPRP